jgi:hypothetical protein
MLRICSCPIMPQPRRRSRRPFPSLVVPISAARRSAPSRGRTMSGHLGHVAVLVPADAQSHGPPARPPPAENPGPSPARAPRPPGPRRAGSRAQPRRVEVIERFRQVLGAQTGAWRRIEPDLLQRRGPPVQAPQPPDPVRRAPSPEGGVRRRFGPRATSSTSAVGRPPPSAARAGRRHRSRPAHARRARSCPSPAPAPASPDRSRSASALRSVPTENAQFRGHLRSGGSFSPVDQPPGGDLAQQHLADLHIERKGAGIAI